MVQAAGNGIHLHTHLRQGEAVNDIGAGGFDLDHLAHGHEDGIVDAQQARLAGLGGIGVGQAQAVKGEAGVGARIFIGPEPLLADRLDVDVHVRRDLRFEIQQLEGRHRDDHQDDHRNDGPGHFQQGVVMDLGRHRVGAGAILHDDPYQQRQHEQAHRDDDVEQLGVERRDAVHDLRFRSLEPDLEVLDLGEGRRGQKGGHRRTNPQFPQKHGSRPRKVQGAVNPALFQILGGDLEGLSP